MKKIIRAKAFPHGVIPVALLSIFLFAGCGAKSVKTQPAAASHAAKFKTPEPDRGYVYIYRPAGYDGSLTAWPIVFDGAAEVEIKNGTFVMWETNPGQHRMVAKSPFAIVKDGEHALTVKGGEVYYFRHALQGSGVVGQLAFQPVDPREGKIDIAISSLVTVVTDPR